MSWPAGFRALARVRWACLWAVAALLSACSPSSKPVGELRILCGASMREPVEILCAQFKDRYPGTEMLLDFGGAETLLPRIISGAPCDIFVCHDPFEQKIQEAGLLESGAAVGNLRPVLLVAPGNPKGIRAMEDLARPGVRLSIGDPRYSTCGQLFRDEAQKRGQLDAVMANVVFQGRTHGEIVMGLLAGHSDAASVWNFIAHLYRDKTETVDDGAVYPEIAVTVLGVNTGANPAARTAFVEFCREPGVAALFAQHGYR